MARNLKIALCGASSMGKTTIAHQISLKYKIPFISGSYSDLIPSTRNQLHKDMITKDPGEIYQQDYQLLNLRRNQLKNKQFYVSDRSFIDNVAYFIDKLAHHIPRCEVDTYIDMCKKLTYEFCTHIIFIPFDKTMIDTWKIEDNNKRVTNPYFQYKVSLLMGYTIEDFIFKDLEPITVINMDHSVNTIFQDSETGIKVLYLHETGMTERQKVIEKFLEP